MKIRVQYKNAYFMINMLSYEFSIDVMETHKIKLVDNIIILDDISLISIEAYLKVLLNQEMNLIKAVSESFISNFDDENLSIRHSNLFNGIASELNMLNMKKRDGSLNTRDSVVCYWKSLKTIFMHSRYLDQIKKRNGENEEIQRIR